MKRFFLVFLLLPIGTCAQQHPSATTISVGLFTNRLVRSLNVMPLGNNTWIQPCASCQRNVLHGPLHIDSLKHPLLLGGNFRIQPDGDVSIVEAAGLYTIVPVTGGFRVTLQLPTERYVAAVLSAEAAPDEPEASLEALAIAARTFALANQRRHSVDGFDLCDSTHCQALRFGHVRPAITQAVRDTAGVTLWSGTRRGAIYYTQHCGGTSEDVSELWPSEHARYLTTHADSYCLRRSPASWNTEVSLSDLADIAAAQHWNIPTPTTGIRIIRRTASGRAKLLELSGPERTVQISASSLRFAINRTLGWNRIRSDLYSVSIVKGALSFSGRGYGHGVGLCQTGAFQMAIEHHSANEILAFYFPGTRAGLNAAGELWHSERLGDVTLRMVGTDNSLAQSVKLAWHRALMLLPTAGEITRPTIIVAPTVELFRQLSSSPGYLLAVTRGDQITLQPLSILRKNGSTESLVLHELLHVLIESQATDKAPLWLREGLAEALADLSSSYTRPMSTPVMIDQMLANPTSSIAYRQAHREAGAIVRILGRKYSVTVMRGWLRDGVPTQVLDEIRMSSNRLLD